MAVPQSNVPQTGSRGPLSGYRVIEFAGIGPGPYAGQLLADLGAEVVCIERPSPGNSAVAGAPTIDSRGKKSVVIDLRKPGASAVALKLVEGADALLEGNRPGVMERLGLGPDVCLAANPKLVYGRMTGWGQTGPWAKVAGHDINYISITGALHAMGKAGEPPMPPLNLVGDYGAGSLFLVMGMLSALLQAEKTGRGDVVDAAIIDGTSSMMGMFYTLSGLGRWTPERESNLLDGGMPFYRCYGTRDGKFMAVGCIEPQFFALMLETLEIDPQEFGGQHDRTAHAAQHRTLEETFASKSRDEWAELFDGLDACVSPVLDYKEAASHPQNQARGGLQSHGPFIHPRTTPDFAAHEARADFTIPAKAEHTKSVLGAAGYDPAEIDGLLAEGLVYSAENS